MGDYVNFLIPGIKELKVFPPALFVIALLVDHAICIRRRRPTTPQLITECKCIIRFQMDMGIYVMFLLSIACFTSHRNEMKR